MFKKFCGLDLGSSSVKIAQINNDGKLENFWVKEYSRDINGNISDESIISATKEIISENLLNKEHFILSIPRHNSIIREIKTPFKDINKIRQIINYEIEPHIPYPINEINFDFFISDINETGSNIVTFVLSNNINKYYEKIINECGIYVTSVTTADIAEFNYLRGFMENDNINVILNFGAKNISLTIINNNKWVFSRSITKGGDYLTELIAHQEQITFQKAEELKINLEKIADKVKIEAIVHKGFNEIFNEIRYTLNSYLKDTNLKEINKIIITGGGANFKDIDTKLFSFLDIKTEKISIEISPLNAQTMYLLGAAYGAALQNKRYFKKSENLISLNLFPKSHDFTLYQKVQIYVAMALLLLIITFVSIDIYLKNKTKWDKISQLDIEINKIFSDTLSNSKQMINPKQQLTNAINDEKKKMNVYFSGLSLNSLSPMDVLREINIIIEKNIKIELYDISINENSVILNGKTMSFKDVDLIKDRLTKSYYFKKVSVDSLKTRNDGKIEFKIVINL